MIKPNIYNVLQGAHISEKATLVAELNNQFVFRVAKGATKPQVRSAVEELFNVKVESVQTRNVPGKRKGFGRKMGQRASWKKAYVKLQPGYDIDFASVE